MEVTSDKHSHPPTALKPSRNIWFLGQGCLGRSRVDLSRWQTELDVLIRDDGAEVFDAGHGSAGFSTFCTAIAPETVRTLRMKVGLMFFCIANQGLLLPRRCRNSALPSPILPVLVFQDAGAHSNDAGGS